MTKKSQIHVTVSMRIAPFQWCTTQVRFFRRESTARQFAARHVDGTHAATVHGKDGQPVADFMAVAR